MAIFFAIFTQRNASFAMPCGEEAKSCRGGSSTWSAYVGILESTRRIDVCVTARFIVSKRRKREKSSRDKTQGKKASSHREEEWKRWSEFEREMIFFLTACVRLIPLKPSRYNLVLLLQPRGIRSRIFFCFIARFFCCFIFLRSLFFGCNINLKWQDDLIHMGNATDHLLRGWDENGKSSLESPKEKFAGTDNTPDFFV